MASLREGLSVNYTRVHYSKSSSDSVGVGAPVGVKVMEVMARSSTHEKDCAASGHAGATVSAVASGAAAVVNDHTTPFQPNFALVWEETKVRSYFSNYFVTIVVHC